MILAVAIVTLAVALATLAVTIATLAVAIVTFAVAIATLAVAIVTNMKRLASAISVKFQMLNLSRKNERTYSFFILLTDNHSSWR